ncbi:MAG: thiamine phosphate synthase [Ancrocorticia sp.]|uniref:thiamine phosphate synthase n=1 Tax=Ancrocorticia sp. TaxID=2593684 RepID=UPI003F9259AA
MIAASPRLAGIDARLYLVTDTAQCESAGRSVAETVYEAVAGGAGIVQVRDKDLDDAGFYSLTREVIAAVAAAMGGSGRYVPVVVNDRVNVARRLLDEGIPIHVHIGQSDTTPARVRALLGPGPLIGLSASNTAQFAAARASGAVDLLGIGPVYDTSTKADAPGGLGAEHLGELVAQAGLPAVGIGGITHDRAAEIRDCGLIGMCVVSAICMAEDPRRAAAELLAAFDPGGLIGGVEPGGAIAGVGPGSAGVARAGDPLTSADRAGGKVSAEESTLRLGGAR